MRLLKKKRTSPTSKAEISIMVPYEEIDKTLNQDQEAHLTTLEEYKNGRQGPRTKDR